MANLKSITLNGTLLSSVAALFLCAGSASAQGTKGAYGPTPVIPISGEEPPARFCLERQM
jgi:hypothetical protein